MRRSQRRSRRPTNPPPRRRLSRRRARARRRARPSRRGVRGARMYEFLDRLINVALPRVRDFKGVPGKGFDGRGNYALGLQEQVIFPEIVYDKVDKIRGMDINIVTTARTDEDAKALLAHLGMPFRE